MFAYEKIEKSLTPDEVTPKEKSFNKVVSPFLFADKVAVNKGIELKIEFILEV